MKEKIFALLSGLLVGFGLALSQMINPENIIGFLDIFGDWNPLLAFVLGGAIGVTAIAFHFVLKQPTPLATAKFHLPTRSDVDRPLLLGSVIFGIGWGIAGYCPGPGVTALALGSPNPILFVLATLAGIITYRWYSNRGERQAVDIPTQSASRGTAA